MKHMSLLKDDYTDFMCHSFGHRGDAVSIRSRFYKSLLHHFNESHVTLILAEGVDDDRPRRCHHESNGKALPVILSIYKQFANILICPLIIEKCLYILDVFAIMYKVVTKCD